MWNTSNGRDYDLGSNQVSDDDDDGCADEPGCEGLVATLAMAQVMVVMVARVLIVKDGIVMILRQALSIDTYDCDDCDQHAL